MVGATPVIEGGVPDMAVPEALPDLPPVPRDFEILADFDSARAAREGAAPVGAAASDSGALVLLALPDLDPLVLFPFPLPEAFAAPAFPPPEAFAEPELCFFPDEAARPARAAADSVGNGPAEPVKSAGPPDGFDPEGAP